MGAAANTPDQPLSLCAVTFEIFDMFGTKTGKSIATTTHVWPGLTWLFRAYDAWTAPTTIGTIRIAQVSTDRSMLAGFQEGAVETGGLDRGGPSRI